MWGYIWLLARKIFRAVARLLACEIRSGPCPQIGSCIEVCRLFFDFEAVTIQNHLFSSETMVPMTLICGGTREGIGFCTMVPGPLTDFNFEGQDFAFQGSLDYRWLETKSKTI